MSESAEQLHLSYLIEDPKALAECLRMRIRSWKQLELYFENGGELEHMDKERIEQLRKRIEVLERYLELYRRGRPVPIDRSFLEASDAVSDAFIDKVDEKLQELKGDPEALIEALRVGEVKGFRNNKVDELEEELRQQRKLPEEERMEEEAIVAELQGFISERGLSVEEMERMLGRFLGGKASSPGAGSKVF
jgi:hypothetical protein